MDEIQGDFNSEVNARGNERQKIVEHLDQLHDQQKSLIKVAHLGTETPERGKQLINAIDKIAADVAMEIDGDKEEIAEKSAKLMYDLSVGKRIEPDQEDEQLFAITALHFIHDENTHIPIPSDQVTYEGRMETAARNNGFQEVQKKSLDNAGNQVITYTMIKGTDV
jgi:hypothetical protein